MANNTDVLKLILEHPDSEEIISKIMIKSRVFKKEVLKIFSPV